MPLDTETVAEAPQTTVATDAVDDEQAVESSRQVENSPAGVSDGRRGPTRGLLRALRRLSMIGRARVDTNDMPTSIDSETVFENRDAIVESEAIGEQQAVELAKSVANPEVPTIDRRPGKRWMRVLTYGVVPGLVLTLALTAGYLKWLEASARDSRLAATEAVRAATDGTIAMLSYRPDTVERDLGAARERLTGGLKDSYTSLTHDVVIPGSKQKQISAVATVPASASVTASPNHAVALVFVNQTVIVGSDPPTNTASRVRVTLEKAGQRWLISGFDPV